MRNRLKPTRDDYIQHLPGDAIKITCKQTGAIVYTFTRNGSPCAMGFSGRAAKPRLHFRYPSEDRRERSVRNWLESNKQSADAKRDRADKAKAITAEFRDKLKPGAILYASWGYDQTNIDWFRVESVSGSFATLTALHGIDAGDGSEGWMTGKTLPGDHSKGEPFRRKIAAGYIRVSHCQFAHLWDGTPKRYSSYA